mgnify:CR=1 FL=1
MTKNSENEKLKVVFIDDERLVRQLLMNCVDWGSLGFAVAGDSPGGQHALDMVADVRPDLVFMDICMPIMDGIELSAEIMKFAPDTRIIIVTGHQDFDYARESIKVGVSDFLLKPINPKEISATALKAKEALEQARSERREVERLKQRLEDNYPHLRERALRQLINGEYDFGEMDQSLEYFDIRFEEPYFQAAVMWIDFQADPDGAQQKTLLINGAKAVFSEILDRYGRIYSYSDDSLVVILSNNSRADLYEALDYIKLELSERFSCVASAGLSRPVHKMEDVQQAYKQAMEALKYKLVCGKGHIVKYDEIINEEREFLRDDKQLDLLGFSLKSGLIQNAEEAAVKALHSLNAEELSRTEQLHAAGAKILAQCLGVMEESGVPAAEVFDDDTDPYETICAMETLPQMEAYLTDCAGRIADKILEANRGKVHGIIQNIKEYIDTHITDPELSLTHVANTFYLNASYLSRIYKQETGYTFVDYIKKIRMEKVLEILKSEDLKVYQLCERVGIEDPHYLSILFKKYTGITISEYKQRLKGNE